jgi:hypothetical protein
LILNEIHDLGNPSIKVLVEDIKEKMLSYMEEEKRYETIDEWRKSIKGQIEEMLDKLKEFIYVKDYTQAAVQSLKLLLRLQNEYEQNLCKKLRAKYNVKIHYDALRQIRY